MSHWFNLEQSQGIARLTLARPDEFNTWSLDMLRELRRVVAAHEAEGRTRVLVIASTGRHFSAGMQLEEFAARPDLLEVGSARARLAFQGLVRELMDCFDVIDRARFPVIAAVQGGCIGAGLDLVAACDLRLCAQDAFFCIQEINLGIVADLGTLQRLPKTMPDAIVREFAYTGRRLPANRAQEIGFVNAVFEDVATLHEGALELAREVAAKSPLAIAGTKLALNHARDHSVAESLAHMAVLQSSIFSPQEIATSVAALRAKQTASFGDLATGESPDRSEP